MKVVHEWLKDYLGDAAPSAEQVADLLTFHAFEIEEVEQVGEQMVIAVDVLPNRSSDCLCHRGIAREIATLTGTLLVHDPLKEKPMLPSTDAISVSIESSADCPRFTASLITNVAVGESPAWLRSRLEALGVRSINNIVDATNYVMYAIGQPLHAYDADLFPKTGETWQFAIRRAREGESISLLPEGGATEDRIVELTGTELLIVDQSTDTPVGLAGVKGGRFAGVHAGTKNILVEAAHFDPVLTRKTARRLGIVIDASKRFENEPTCDLPLYAQREVAELIAKIAGGEMQGVIDVYPNPAQATSVLVRSARVNALLGLQLTTEEMVNILERLGAAVTENADGLQVVSPFERTDLNIEEDYIEEIGRVHGLNHIASVTPAAVPLRQVNARHYYAEAVREILTKQGFSEVITSSFRNKDKVQLQNALASDKSYVRSRLAKNLDEALTLNVQNTDVLGLRDVRIFEIGTVFQSTEAGVGEHVALVLGVRTKQSGFTPADDEKLSGALAALAPVLGEVAWATEKGTAECNFTKVVAVLPQPTAYEPITARADIQYRPFSNYPAVSRDIAMWVAEGTEAAAVEHVLKSAAGPLCIRTTLFDEFTKDGRTSFAFRLVFQSNEKTLTDSEVNQVMDQILHAVAGQGWEVR